MKGSKKLIAIAFSDLHLNIWANFNEHHKRTMNGFKVLDKIAGICSKEQVPPHWLETGLHFRSASDFL